MGIIITIQESMMKHYTLSIIIIISMVATPLLAAASLPLSCDDQKCCHAMEAHHDMAGMIDDACQCHMVPLSPCRIAADLQSPQLAIPLPTDRGQFENLIQMYAAAETGPHGSLPRVLSVANQTSIPNGQPPLIYLLTCTIII